MEISGDEVGKVRIETGEPRRDLVGHCKDFGFYFEGNEELLLLLSQGET